MIPFFKIAPSENSFLKGATVASLFSIAFMLVSLSKYSIPNIPALFSTMVIYVAFRFGFRAGLFSAVISWICTCIHFSVPGHLFNYTEIDLIRIIMWGVFFPFQAGLIGHLKESLLIKVESEKVLQQKLVSASKLLALSEMASGIAHEINSPLSSIILNAELIEMKNLKSPHPDADITKRSQIILDTAHRVAKIIRGLRDFSRDASKDERKLFTVQQLVDLTFDFCGEKFKNHKIQVQIASENLNQQIYGKITELSQTLLNLLNNSFDAIHGSSDPWIKLQVEVVDKNILLRVYDSGHPIPQQIIEKVFQPFFTTKPVGKGTGLGLSISKGILENHGGDLFYDSASGNTCFVMQLPTIEEAAQSISQ